MTARRRVENVFSLFARGARTREDPPLLYYTLGDQYAVVVDLPVHLTFREGGRPRSAHMLPDPVSSDGYREFYVLLRCPDLDTEPGMEQNWWFKINPDHQRQRETCTCAARPAWGQIDCAIHGLVF